MNLSITARGYKAPDRLKKYLTDKLDKKKKLYEDVIDAEIVLSYVKQTQVAEIRLNVNHKALLITEKSDDIFKSIDQALDNMERQIKRYKEKRRDHKNNKIVNNLAV
jgi:putative sigma-54 modulation protein